MRAFSGAITEFVASTMEPPSAISPSSYSSYIFNNLPSGRSAVFLYLYLSQRTRVSTKAEKFLGIAGNGTTGSSNNLIRSAPRRNPICSCIALAISLFGTAGIISGIRINNLSGAYLTILLSLATPPIMLIFSIASGLRREKYWYINVISFVLFAVLLVTVFGFFWD